MLTMRTISFGPDDHAAHLAFLLDQAAQCHAIGVEQSRMIRQPPSEDNLPMWKALLEWAATEAG